MKAASKVVFLLTVLLLAFCPALFAQADTVPNPPDEEFNLFLLAMLSVGVFAMMGATIIGAVVASLILFFLFALIAVGVLSTSVAIGLYKRSYAAGFKSFLIILFTVMCAGIGYTGALIAGTLFELPISASTAALTGAIGGFLGGWLMALATYQTIQLVIHYFAKRFGFIP